MFTGYFQYLTKIWAQNMGTLYVLWLKREVTQIFFLLYEIVVAYHSKNSNMEKYGLSHEILTRFTTRNSATLTGETNVYPKYKFEFNNKCFGNVDSVDLVTSKLVVFLIPFLLNPCMS